MNLIHIIMAAIIQKKTFFYMNKVTNGNIAIQIVMTLMYVI
jgi:hypothetical protein